MRIETPYTSSELQQLRTALAEREARLTMMLATAKQEALQDLSMEAVGELSHRHTHLADTGAMEHDQSLALDSLERVNHQLSEIQAAKGRLALGSFGACEGCEESIAIARLLKVPEARYCGPCQRTLEESEKLHRHTSRLDAQLVELSDLPGKT